MNVSRFKRIVVVASVFSVGALAFGLAERAKVAGQTPNPGSQLAYAPGGLDPRPLGLDGRPVGPPPAGDATTVYAKSYYVGDLVLANPPNREQPGTASPTVVQPTIDFTPMVDLIESTIAPGTWRVQDETCATPNPCPPLKSPSR